MIPDSFLQELKLRNNIKDVICEYVKLKKNGRNYVGLCPFHNEKTPSFTVNTNEDFFYCFGCNTGGDIITFIRKIENLSYIDAIKFLADKSGLQVPDSDYSNDNSKLRLRCYEANREAAKYYNKLLYSPEGKMAFKYLTSRSIMPNTITKFGLGYSLNSRFALVNHLKNLNFTDDELIATNLAFKSKNGKLIDRFCNRIMFPIIDVNGNVIGFGGRIMNNDLPKYLNTSDTLIFKKSKNLFSLNFAKKTKEDYFILVEGYMDVISLFQAGFENSVATLGTSLTTEQAFLISRYTKEVIIAYDNDEAGTKATKRAIDIFRNTDVLIRVVNLKWAKDPDEYIRSNGKNGPIKFKQLLQNSSNDIEYMLQKIKLDLDLNIPEGRIKYLNEASKILANLNNKIEQEIYSSKLSEEIGVQKTTIMNQIKKVSKKFKKQDNKLINTKKINNNEPLNLNKLRSEKAEEALIVYLIANQDMLKTINEKINENEFINEFNKKLYSIIIKLINEKKPIDLTVLSKHFTDNEVNEIARILTYKLETINNIECLDQYVKIIKQEHEKTKIIKNPNINEEELKKYVRILKEQKK